MIDIVLYMLIVGLLGLVKLRARDDRIMSLLMFFVLAGTFFIYGQQNLYLQDNGFSLLWSTSELGNITLDFIPTQNTNQTIVPLFLISLFVILNNNLFKYEERRSSFNSFIIFNLISLSLIICARNYVQLITMVFVSDILGYLILKDADSSHRYVVYNFFSDMLLFTILALACSRTNSLELTGLLGYEQIGHHKDFLGLLTALALFIKIGCFPFHSYLQDLNHTRFQRMSTVGLLTSSLSGILVLLKLHNLLLVSNQFLIIYEIVVALTFIVGIMGFITKRHIQKKILYFNMATIAILLQIIAKNNFNWNLLLSIYYMGIYLFNCLFFQVYLYQNREVDITKMINAQNLNHKALKTLLIQLTMLASMFIVLLYKIAHEINDMTILYAGIIIIIELSMVLNHIYQSPNTHRRDLLNPNSWRNVALLVNFIILFMGLYYEREKINFIILIAGAFLCLIASPLGKYTRRIYEDVKIQEMDIGKTLFSYIMVRPVIYISRAFWLMIDLFLSEKMITVFASRMEKVGISLFLTINKQRLRSYILLILIGLIVFAWAYVRSLYQ